MHDIGYLLFTNFLWEQRDSSCIVNIVIDGLFVASVVACCTVNGGVTVAVRGCHKVGKVQSSVVAHASGCRSKSQQIPCVAVKGLREKKATKRFYGVRERRRDSLQKKVLSITEDEWSATKKQFANSVRIYWLRKAKWPNFSIFFALLHFPHNPKKFLLSLCPA